MSLGGSKTSQSSSSQSSGSSYGINASQTYLDQQQQANQQGLVDRFSGGFNQLGAMPGLNFNRQDTLAGLRQVGTTAQQYGQNLRAQGARGRNMLQGFASRNNPYVNSQIHGLAQDFGQMYREQILPGIGNQAQMAGQRGSSRQGIAEALGAQRVGQEFGQAATNLRANAYQQQQQAAGQLAGLGQQGSMQAFGLANQARGMQGSMANQFAQTGLQGAAQPFMIGSQVIGAPSVLSQSLGLDYAQQQSSSSGSGSGGSLSMGFI